VTNRSEARNHIATSPFPPYSECSPMSTEIPVSLGTNGVWSLLEAHGSRAEGSITDEMRERTDCNQFRLESIFFEAKPRPYLVLVRRIGLDPRRAWEATGSVVKFSKRAYGLVRSDVLKVATAEHYRTYEGGGVGIGDADEGVYRESLGSYFKKWNPEAFGSFWWDAVTSGSVTYQPDSVWLYCTSLPPRSRRERFALEQEFEADCTTGLGKPAMVARELGSALARMSPSPSASFDEWFDQKQHDVMLAKTPLKGLVRVTHGPVVYTDNAGPLVDAVPLLHRAAAIPFVKSLDYTHQREYRFTVSTLGKPAQETLLVPTTPELKGLAAEVN